MMPLRSLITLGAALAFLAGCTDANEVNAAFRQNRVSWYLFDPARPDGLRTLPGFDQDLAVRWVPRDQSVRATSLAAVPAAQGAVAVSHLGLLVLRDADGALASLRPGSKLPLVAYETDRLAVWQDKVFLSLRQPAGGSAPPASLAWWTSGQPRLALYPVPSQTKDPSRQAVRSVFSTPSATVAFLWKFPEGNGWTFDRSIVSLASGQESELPAWPGEAAPVLDAGHAVLAAKVAQRIGADVPVESAVGDGPALVFTASGWVSAASTSGARLYRLPDLGLAGRYTGALYLERGWVFSWETSFRGYAGAAGLVYIPTPVLAP